MKLKYWLRSGSFKFMKDNYDKSHTLNTYKYNNKDIYYRTGSSDMLLIYEILLKKGFQAEYFTLQNTNPKVIVDIGANIGISAIYFAKTFPQAEIHAFEPLGINYDVLLKNTEKNPNIKTYNFGLGEKDGSFDISILKESDYLNFGGSSFIDGIGDSDDIHHCEVKNSNNALQLAGIKNIDILKIDTKGAEYDILTNLDKETLSKTQWIAEELHGNKDFELLTYLEKLDFSVGLKKYLHSDIFIFYAASKDIVQNMSRKEKNI